MKNHEPMIVVVDPDEDRATALSSQLDRRGYYVVRRSSGADAVQCAAEYHPDLVLSRPELADLENPELLRSIHDASPSTQVLFVPTNRPDDDGTAGRIGVTIGNVPEGG